MNDTQAMTNKTGVLAWGMRVLRRWVKRAWFSVGVVSLLLGVAGWADNLSTWLGWMSALWSIDLPAIPRVPPMLAGALLGIGGLVLCQFAWRRWGERLVRVVVEVPRYLALAWYIARFVRMQFGRVRVRATLVAETAPTTAAAEPVRARDQPVADGAWQENRRIRKGRVEHLVLSCGWEQIDAGVVEVPREYVVTFLRDLDQNAWREQEQWIDLGEVADGWRRYATTTLWVGGFGGGDRSRTIQVLVTTANYKSVAGWRAVVQALRTLPLSFIARKGGYKLPGER